MREIQRGWREDQTRGERFLKLGCKERGGFF
jgi:hypothetical protein